MPGLTVTGSRLLSEVEPRANPVNPEFNLWLNRTGGSADWSYHWFLLDRAPGIVQVQSLAAPGPGSRRRITWGVTDQLTNRPVAFRQSSDTAISVPRPAAPTCLRISQTGDRLCSADVWFIRGFVRVNTTSFLSASNQAGRRGLRRVGDQEGQLGPIMREGRGRDAAGERRDRSAYGGAVEIYGQVFPGSVPCRFHLVRQLILVDVWYRREPNVNCYAIDHLQNQDDTSDADFMQQEPDFEGKVYDVDCPGDEFNETDHAGARHRWQFYAQQCLVIGPCPAFQRDPNTSRVIGAGPWDLSASRGTRISSYRRWRANLLPAVTHEGSVNAPPALRWDEPPRVLEAEESLTP